MENQEKEKCDPEEYFFQKVIEIPVYRGLFQIIFAKDPQRVAEYIGTDNKGEVFAHTYGHNMNDDECITVVLNPDRDDINITFGDISHEALHAGSMLFASRGILADHYNDEALAYIVGWFTNQIYESLVKQKKFEKIKYSNNQ